MKSFLNILVILMACRGLATEPIPTMEPPIDASEPPPLVSEAPSAPTESQLVISPPNPWHLGLQFGGLGAMSTVDYQEGYSGGLGWSVGLQAEKLLTPNLRFLGSFGYQSLSVGRFLGSSGGVIVDPSSQYIQTQKGPFLQGMLGVPLMSGHFDVGVEYFQPNTAQQISGIFVYDYTPSKFLFVVAGPSMSWKIRGDWELEAHAWFFINTVGESKFKLLGGRLGLALRTPL